MTRRTAIVNIGTLISGDINNPVLGADCLLLENGVIDQINPDASTIRDAQSIIDVKGMTLAPGLFDSHVHPVFGEYSPRLRALDWVESYLQGGITSMISTGELHLPGRPTDPQGVKCLAILAAKSFRNLPPSAVKLQGGTMILESGLQQEDFAEAAEAGVRAVKFIRSIDDPSEAVQMSRWAKKHNMKVIIHCGGTSLPDVPTTTAEKIMQIDPDVLAHLNGGPTALSSDDIDLLVRDTDWAIDIVRFGNLKAALRIIEIAHEIGSLDRVILGTDSPTGSGMEPLGILHLVTTLSSLGELPPESILAMATGNTARVYELPQGQVRTDAPADLVLLDAPLGSSGEDALGSIKLGDIPAVAMVMIDGEIKVGRSRNTPPPKRTYTVS